MYNVSMSHNAGILLSEESNVNQTATVTDNNKLTYDSEHNADRLAVRENIDIDPNIHFHRDAQPKNNSAYDQTLATLRNQVDHIFKQAKADFKHIESKVYEQQQKIRQLFDELEAYEQGSNSELKLPDLLSVAQVFQNNLTKGKQQLFSLYCDANLPALIDKASENLSDDTAQYVEHCSELLAQDFQYINSVFEENLAILSALIVGIQVANQANRSKVAQSTKSDSDSYHVHDLSHKPLGVHFPATPGIFRARSASPQQTQVKCNLPPTPPKSHCQKSYPPIPDLRETRHPPAPSSIQQVTSFPTRKPNIPDTHFPSSPPHPPAQHYITAPAVVTEQPTQLPAQHYSPAPTAATRQSRRTLVYSPALFYSPGEHSLNAGELLTTRNKPELEPRSNMDYANHNNDSQHRSQTERVDQITEALNKLQSDTEALKNMQVNKTAASDTSSTNYSLRHIPKFAGNTNDDFEEWRRKFMNKIKYLTWPAEQQILLLDDALTDRANLFYRKLPADSKQSMTHILNALEKQYGNENMDLAERAMQRKRKQMPGESIEDYTSAILKLVHRLRMDRDIDQVALYIDGLDPEIRGAVYKMKPQSIDQAEKDARLASSTMSIKTNDLLSKEIAAEVIMAMNKNVNDQATMATMMGADQYTVLPQTVAPQQNSHSSQQPMPNMVEHTAPIAFTTPQAEQYTQQMQYPQQQYNQPNWRNNNARPNPQNRGGNNQYHGNNGYYQNNQTRQYSYSQQQPNSHNNRPSQEDYRPFCRACDCAHLYGAHIRPFYNGQRAFDRWSTGNARPTAPLN